MNNQAFENLLESAYPALSEEKRAGVVRFRNLLLDEGARQNLTRLTEPADFLDGHVADVGEMLSLSWIDYPAMDLGSGGGVPGLLSATIRKDSWVLAESEGNKAEFLKRAVSELGLQDCVRVFSGRAEDFLRATPPSDAIQSIVARAVGPISRIYSWIRKCSTWNNLVLLKGPGWEQEWADFQAGPHRKELTVSQSHRYTVGAEKKKRIIVRIDRVPRGTKK